MQTYDVKRKFARSAVVRIFTTPKKPTQNDEFSVIRRPYVMPMGTYIQDPRPCTPILLTSAEVLAEKQSSLYPDLWIVLYLNVILTYMSDGHC